MTTELKCTCTENGSKIPCMHGVWECLCCGKHLAKPTNHDHA